jgi:hypothetical protein
MVTFQKNKNTYKVNPRLSMADKMACLDAMLNADNYFGAVATLNMYLIQNNIDGFGEVKTVADIDNFINEGFLEKMLEVNKGSLREDYEEMIDAYKHEASLRPITEMKNVFVETLTRMADTVEKTNMEDVISNLKESFEEVSKLKVEK